VYAHAIACIQLVVVINNHQWVAGLHLCRVSNLLHSDDLACIHCSRPNCKYGGTEFGTLLLPEWYYLPITNNSTSCRQ